MEKAVIEWNGSENAFEPIDKNVTFQSLSPKAMLLYGAAKCLGMTTIMLLKKMDVEPMKFQIEVNGELSEVAIPAQNIFTMITYKLSVECNDPNNHHKINRAIELAHEKYCGTSRMMRMIAPVTYDVHIHSAPEAQLAD